MRSKLLLLLYLMPSYAFAAPFEGDDYRIDFEIRKEHQIYDASPNCEQTRKALPERFRKLLRRDPECKPERLVLTFKKKQLLRTQSLIMRARTGIDGLKECDSWLKAETNHLRSTFLYGSCRPPLPGPRSSEFASVGFILSLPGMEELDLPRSETFYSRQVKEEGDEFVMETTKKVLIAFEQFKERGSGGTHPSLSTNPAKKLCEDWRELALKRFLKELTQIEPCSGHCSCRISCSCFAASNMNFRGPVQG